MNVNTFVLLPPLLHSSVMPSVFFFILEDHSNRIGLCVYSMNINYVDSQMFGQF